MSNALLEPPSLAPTTGKPKDPVKALEQRLLLTEQENRKLLRRISELTQKLAEKEGRDPQLALDALLEEFEQGELERLRQERAEAQAKNREEKKKRRKPQRGHGPRPQAALPVVEQVVELDEDSKACKTCGGDRKSVV